MLRLFKGTSPGVILIIITLAVAFWVVSLNHPGTHQFHTVLYPMPLQSLLSSLFGSSAFLPLLISLVMVLIIASLLVSFNTGSFFINERTFLPAIVYIILSSLIPYQAEFNPVLPATLLMIFAFIRITASYRQAGTSYNYFDAALLISTGSLLYANLMWFGILLFVGIYTLRNINLQETGIAIIGLITPYALLYGVYYVIGHDLSELTTQIANSLFKEAADYEWSRMLIVTSIVVGITIIVSLFHLLSVFNSKKVSSRKIFTLLLWVMLISALVYILVPSASVEMISFFIIPASYVLSHYYVFMKRKKIVPELMFTGTTVLVIVMLVLRFLSYH
jgi:hypothetical protein